mmetsp:Transcript_46204/g.86262  ORF Transcript_46204/g.86262 Transcript_46204/m.86262 type:complete len:490 (-) Transcript_46204:119-1588(-)
MGRAAVDAIGLHAFRPWTPPGLRADADAATPAREPKAPNVIPAELVNKLHREAVAMRFPGKKRPESAARQLVRRACAALGRSEAEAAHWADRLEAEWLEDLSQLRTMSEEDWARLDMPMGLRSQLCQYLGIQAPRPSPAKAPRPSSAPARRTASRPRHGAPGGRAYAADSLWEVMQAQGQVEKQVPKSKGVPVANPPAAAPSKASGSSRASRSSGASSKGKASQGSRRATPPEVEKESDKLEAWKDVPVRGMMQEAWHHSVLEAQMRRMPRTEILVERLRAALGRVGRDPLPALIQSLRAQNAIGSDGLVSTQDLQVALRHVGVGISDTDIAALSGILDRAGSGSINLEAWLRLMRGPLSLQRGALVREVFRQLDTDRDGLVRIRDLQEKFLALRHPDVEAGRKTEREVLFELLVALGEADADHDGRLTLYEFLQYNEQLSAGISSDHFFMHVVRSVWGLDSGTFGTSARNKRRAYEGNIRITESGLSG